MVNSDKILNYLIKQHYNSLQLLESNYDTSVIGFRSGLFKLFQDTQRDINKYFGNNPVKLESESDIISVINEIQPITDSFLGKYEKLLNKWLNLSVTVGRKHGLIMNTHNLIDSDMYEVNIMGGADNKQGGYGNLNPFSDEVSFQRQYLEKKIINNLSRILEENKLYESNISSDNHRKVVINQPDTLFNHFFNQLSSTFNNNVSSLLLHRWINYGLYSQYEQYNEYHVWYSREDEHVRPSHQKLHGEVRKVGELFSNGCLYPGDENGIPEEVMNCRCYTLPFNVNDLPSGLRSEIRKYG